MTTTFNNDDFTAFAAFAERTRRLAQIKEAGPELLKALEALVVKCQADDLRLEIPWPSLEEQEAVRAIAKAKRDTP